MGTSLRAGVTEPSSDWYLSASNTANESYGSGATFRANIINSIGYKTFISQEKDLIDIDKIKDLNKENNFFFLPNDHKLIQSTGQ